MYSERIDNIENALAAYADDLRNTVIYILSDIRNRFKVSSINVRYYTDSEIDNWYFAADSIFKLGCEGVCVGEIVDIDSDDPAFKMLTEDGEPWGEMSLYDFNVNDLLGLARQMNDLLNVVLEDGVVKK